MTVLLTGISMPLMQIVSSNFSFTLSYILAECLKSGCISSQILVHFTTLEHLKLNSFKKNIAYLTAENES